MHAITKDGTIQPIAISLYSVHELIFVSMPIFYRTPEEMADKEIVASVCLSMNQSSRCRDWKDLVEFYEHLLINQLHSTWNF